MHLSRMVSSEGYFRHYTVRFSSRDCPMSRIRMNSPTQDIQYSYNASYKA